MNFSDILEDVSRGNFSSCAELNNFKQVDREHIEEIFSKDIRSPGEKHDWLADIEDEWKPEVVNLIKEVYNNSMTKRSSDEDVLNPLNADNILYLEEPGPAPRARSKILSMKQSGYDLFNPFEMGDDEIHSYGGLPPVDKMDSAPVFKSIPQLFRGTAESAGHDITSLVDVVVPARGFASVETGVRISIPSGYHVDVRPRSGLGFRNQLVAFNGVIDSDYSSINPDDARCSNTIKVGMFNFSDSDYTIKAGDRIAQLVICKSYKFDNSIVGESTSHNGFGSTGGC